MIISSINLHIVWTPLNLLYLFVVVISGGLIFIALNLITATRAFWIIESIPVTQIVFNTHEFARFPLTIYPRLIQLLLTILILWLCLVLPGDPDSEHRAGPVGVAVTRCSDCPGRDQLSRVAVWVEALRGNGKLEVGNGALEVGN